MSYQTWGFLLLGVCLVPALLLAWKRPASLTAVLVSASFAALAFFELMTRMHERYFFLVVPLLAIGAVLRVWIIPLFLGASGLFVLNLWYVWHNYTDVHANQALTFLASDLSVLLFLTTGASLLWLLIGRGENRDRGHDRPELWTRAAGARNINLDGLINALPALASRRVALSGWILGLILACAVVAGLWAGRAAEGVDGDIQVLRVETLGYRSWQDTGARDHRWPACRHRGQRALDAQRCQDWSTTGRLVNPQRTPNTSFRPPPRALW